MGGSDYVPARTYQHKGELMKRKNIWILIVGLLVCGLSVYAMFGGKSSREITEPSSIPAENTDTLSVATEMPESVPPTEQSATEQPQESEEQAHAIAVKDPSDDTELPEIEIPSSPAETEGQGNTVVDAQHGSTGHESSVHDESAGEADAGIKTSEPTTQDEAEKSDDVVDEDGDNMLPEIP